MHTNLRSVKLFFADINLTQILLAFCLMALCSSRARAQALSSGGSYGGTILSGQTNTYTFTATNGNRIVLRGGVLTTTNFFDLWLRVLDPVGTLVGDSGGGSSGLADEVALTTTNSGTYTVLVSDSSYGGFTGSGAYRLYFAEFPGPFTVPPGDSGGPMTNGGNYPGTIQIGELDLWSFTASSGNSVVVRIGQLTSTNYFDPWLRIYDPNGVLVGDSGAPNNASAEELAFTPTNTGTYTVLVSDSSYGTFGGTGQYQLYYSQFPGPFIVPTGDEGGPMTNGGNYHGTIQVGDLDLWSFTASAGNRFVLRIGQLTSTNFFDPWLRIYDPNGVLVGDSGAPNNAGAEELALTATNAGTYTVLVADSSYGTFGGSGEYELYYSQFPGPFIVPAGDAGGPVTSGGSYNGTIQIGELDMWSFSASTGNRFVVRIGQLTSTNFFDPWLRIYDPNGVLVGDSGAPNNASAEELALTATNSGTYTVLVSDSSYGTLAGSGGYQLYFALFPGPFIVPSGDAGGPITSGGRYGGTIQVGELDLWSFTASTGDPIIVRIGQVTSTNFFDPWLRIYDPNGVLVGDSGAPNNAQAEEVALTATNSGTYTVLVADSSYGTLAGSGDYELYFAVFPGPFIVPAGDGGGLLTNGLAALGTIQTGELDLYRFTACKGDILSLQATNITSTNFFNPWLRLYGPSGTLVADSGSGSSTPTATITVQATNSGAYILVVSDASYGTFAGSGTYELTSNGLYDGLKLCTPGILGTNVNVSVVGGISNATYILFTQTNVDTPVPSWIPIRTNQLDFFGAFTYTNVSGAADPSRFFLLRAP
jgi:cysteine synthase